MKRLECDYYPFHSLTVNAISGSLSFFLRHWVNWIALVEVRFIRNLSELLLLSPRADIRWLIIHVWFPSNASLHTFSNLKHLLWEWSCPWSCMASGREANSINIHYQLCESVEISNLPWLLSYEYLPIYDLLKSQYQFRDFYMSLFFAEEEVQLFPVL